MWATAPLPAVIPRSEAGQSHTKPRRFARLFARPDPLPRMREWLGRPGEDHHRLFRPHHDFAYA